MLVYAHMFTVLSSSERKILSILSTAPQQTQNIYKQLCSSIDSPITEQHYYRLLKQLSQKEIITQTYGNTNLNPIFIKSQKIFYTNIDNSHSLVGDFLLQEKESAVFRFRSLQAADIFWGDIAVKLSKDTSEDIILYNIHQFVLLIRTKNENVYYQKITGEGKRNVYIYIGAQTKHDKAIKNLITTKNVHYWASGKKLFKDHVFINTYGDHVLQVTFQKHFITKISKAFNTAQSLGELKGEINKILPTVGVISFKITRNANSAKKIRESIIKSFK